MVGSVGDGQRGAVALYLHATMLLILLTARHAQHRELKYTHYKCARECMTLMANEALRIAATVVPHVQAPANQHAWLVTQCTLRLKIQLKRAYRDGVQDCRGTV